MSLQLIVVSCSIIRIFTLFDEKDIGCRIVFFLDLNKNTIM